MSVKIYERDWASSSGNDDVIAVRTSRAEIQVNYQDDNTPIIGSGATIIIIADTDEMSYLEDMLTSHERQFMCVIEYNSIIVFRGYSICDLNERQLLPYAEVTMQFADYMHRLEEYFPARLQNIGGYANVYSLIRELLTLTEFDLPLYVNSTLFENTMNGSRSHTCLTQMAVQNAQFYTDMFHYDNIYDAVNKCLQPLNAFLYYFKDLWVIERQEDITTGGHWVEYSGGVAISQGLDALTQRFNKQDGDWNYTSLSQIIEYDSGLKTLILELKDQKLDSLVFNNYTKDMLRFTTETFPAEGDLIPNTWYADAGLTGLTNGLVYFDIQTWIHFNAIDHGSPWIGGGDGLYYDFGVFFPETLLEHEELGVKTPFLLTISYKASTDKDIVGYKQISPRYLLRLNGGLYSDWWVKVASSYTSPAGVYVQGPLLILFAPDSDPLSDYEALNPAGYFYQEGGPYENTTVWNVQKVYDLNTYPIVVFHSGTVMSIYSDGLWQLLGQPTNQRFTIMFLPTWFKLNIIHEMISNYIGDIEVVCSTQTIENKIEYHLNENFFRTDTVELYLFDLPDPNYSNGLLLDREYSLSESSGDLLPLSEFTNEWSSRDWSDPPAPLYEIYAKCKFRKYGRTIHRLKGKILTDNIMKVFSILTDNNIVSRTEGEDYMQFILNGYTWDLVNGTYDIDAEEYSGEDIVVEGVEYDSAGTGVPNAPDAPAWITADLAPVIDVISVNWYPVGGNVIGYKLQRSPFYHILQGVWEEMWWQYYVGTNTHYVDDIWHTGPSPAGYPIKYRVCAYNSYGDSAWTEITMP